MKVWMRVAVLGALGSAGALAQHGPVSDADRATLPPLEKMPEALELRFALSAAPPHLRRDATTYLLDPARGYTISRRGTNGVSCIVVRSDWQWPDRPFRNDIFWPVCYDAEGSKTLLQDYLLTAELRAQGMDAKQAHQQIVTRFGSTAYPNPSRAGIAYMIAPLHRAYGPGPEPISMNMPHYMFYAPGLKDADIGGNGFSTTYPFVMSTTGLGRDDVIIMVVGETEKAGLLRESSDLLTRLCSYRAYLCTTSATRHLPNHLAGKR